MYYKKKFIVNAKRKSGLIEKMVVEIFESGKNYIRIIPNYTTGFTIVREYFSFEEKNNIGISDFWNLSQGINDAIETAIKNLPDDVPEWEISEELEQAPEPLFSPRVFLAKGVYEFLRKYAREEDFNDIIAANLRMELLLPSKIQQGG